MPNRLRSLVAFVLLLLSASIAVDAVFAQDAPPPDAPAPDAPAAEAPVAAALPAERASPRKTVFGFLAAMNDVAKERVTDLDAARLRATTFLQLGTSDPGTSDPAQRVAAGWPLALQLHRAIDLHRVMESDEVPDGSAIGDASYWSENTPHGSLTVIRTPDGWLFSAETLARLDNMVAEFEATGTQRRRVVTVADRVRKRFPALAGTALFLQHWQWLGLVTLFLLCWIAHKIFAFVVETVLVGFLRRRGWLGTSADAARAAARPVGFFGVALLIALLGPWLELPVTPVDLHKYVVSIGAKVFASVGAILILYRLADVLAERLRIAADATESRLDDQLVPLLRKSLKILVTVGGVLFILDNLEADIWSLLAGAGVAGLAFAFAAQDTIKNLFGSVTVFLDRPFQVGDWVIVGGVEGTVEEVGFRSTRVRTFYNSLVSVPNSKLVDGVVDNMGVRQYRRFKTTVGVRYDTPPERLEAFCHGMREIVRANEHMRQDYFEVYLNDWGASSLNILVYVFFEVPDWDAELRERQNFMLEVIRLARDLGVGFAFPTQTIEIEALPDKRAPAPDPMDVEALAAVAAGYGRGGDRARPAGTQDFSTRPRGDAEEEARGTG